MNPSRRPRGKDELDFAIPRYRCGSAGRSGTPGRTLADPSPRIAGEIVIVSKTLVGCLLGLCTLARILYVSTAPLKAATFRLTDDSFYYFNVARNIVLGHGVTFDQINLTNGFHPLWMLCLLPAYFVTGGDPETSLRLVLGLVTVIAGATLWVAYRCVAAYAGRAAALVAVCALFTPFCLNPLINGLETGLLILLLFLTIWASRTYDLLSCEASARRNALLAVLLAVVFLCRLDTMFVVLGVFAMIVVRSLRDGRDVRAYALLARKIIQVGTISALLVAPYLFWNYATYGHVVPISGQLKTTFPAISFSPDRLSRFHSQFGEGMLVLSSVIILWLMAARLSTSAATTPTRSSGIRLPGDILVAIWIGSLAHFVNTMLFMNWAVYWWHYAGYIPMTVLLGALAFARIHRAIHASARVTLLATLGIAAIAVYAHHLEAERKGEHHGPWYDAAIWATKALPSNAVVGMTDCGLFGYFCGRRTVNLDGVINGYEYQQALRDHRLSEYLQECGVTHIADYEVQYRDDTYAIKLPARLHRRPGGAILATPSAEVYRSEPYAVYNKADDVHFAIWDIRRLRIVDDAAHTLAFLSPSRYLIGAVLPSTRLEPIPKTVLTPDR